jgi:hypothetical protein
MKYLQFTVQICIHYKVKSSRGVGNASSSHALVEYLRGLVESYQSYCIIGSFSYCR